MWRREMIHSNDSTSSQLSETISHATNNKGYEVTDFIICFKGINTFCWKFRQFHNNTCKILEMHTWFFFTLNSPLNNSLLAFLCCKFQFCSRDMSTRWNRSCIIISMCFGVKFSNSYWFSVVLWFLRLFVDVHRDLMWKNP